MKYINKVFVSLGILLALLLVPMAQNASASTMINTTKLVKITNGLQGIKYKYGGTTTSGFDCSGYVGYVFNSMGISLPRSSSAMYNVGSSVSKQNLQPGDLVFFNTSGKGISHVGIYIGNGQFSHSANSGVGVSKINDPYYWGKRYVGAKRVAGISTNDSSNRWVKKENQWYYYIKDKVQTGWIQDNGKWYFSNENGVMLKGWQKIGNKWYYLNSSGAMVTGWSKVNGKWYFHASSGTMLTGWILDKGKWYYLYNSGEMAHSTTIGGYKLASSGAWIR